MAVRGLSGAWVLAILKTSHPDGVLRRVLLNEFASILVTPRSSRGAKGRLARRLYSKLASLQHRGKIIQREGAIYPLTADKKPTNATAIPALGALLERKLFLVFMAEDRDGPNAPRLQPLRWDFLANAVEAGWSIPQIATALGITAVHVNDLIARPPK